MKWKHGPGQTAWLDRESGSMVERHRGRQALVLVLALFTFTFLAELVGAWISNSLALLADAFHMLTDLSALWVSFIAMWMAERPATARRTFGYYRVEILAALVNAGLLWIVVIGILWKAWERLWTPVPILVPVLISVAAFGLLVNLIGMAILYRWRHISLNLRTAFLHVMADTLGSISAIVAGVAIFLRGWLWLDAVVSILVSGLIFYTAWGVIREAVHVLMEGTPSHIDLDAVRQALLEIPGIQDVHDLHVWTVTRGVEAMSGHAVVEDLNRTHDILMEARRVMETRFNIQHITLQIECCDLRSTEPRI